MIKFIKHGLFFFFAEYQMIKTSINKLKCGEIKKKPRCLNKTVTMIVKHCSVNVYYKLLKIKPF